MWFYELCDLAKVGNESDILSYYTIYELKEFIFHEMARQKP